MQCGLEVTHNTCSLNLNDIWKINLEKVHELSWVEVIPKGLKPRERHGHTMNALHHYLVVFGGIDVNGVYLNDLFIFNTHDNEWCIYPYLGLSPILRVKFPGLELTMPQPRSTTTK